MAFVQIIEFRTSKLDEMEKKAATDSFQKKLAAFVEADKAGDQAALKGMIADFAAGNAHTN